MNKKIQLLAEQAGMYVDVNGEPWPKWMGAEECESAYARFAELIVKECMSSLYLNGYDDAMMQIKEHFGVNE
jgi:hypothetical protein